MSAFVAVDLGASSGRVLLGNFDGERFSVQELHRFSNTPVTVQGSLYWNVLALWQDICQGLSQVKASSTPVLSIGVDTWGVDFALLDKAGRLLANPRHYRDPRTRGIIDRLGKQMPHADIYARTGIQFLELNTLPQLYSMVEQQDPLLEAASQALMMPDLFHYWLSGTAACEYSNASTTQLLDANSRHWDLGLMQAFSIPKLFPDLVEPGTILGSLQAEVCEQTGLPATVKVIAPATHDTGSAVAAVPYLDATSAYLSSGTWSLLGVEVGSPIINDSMLRLNYSNEGGVAGSIRLLKNVAGMWLLEESRRQWQREGQHHDWPELLQQAEAASAHQSFINPDAAVFTSPGDLPSAIRNYCQASAQAIPQTVGDIVRCILESLALKYRQTLEGLEHILGHKLSVLRIVGGGSQNHLLNQFTANACGKAVLAGPVEATALGNIMVQALALGELGSIAEGREAIARSVQLHSYEPSQTGEWDSVYERFLAVQDLPASGGNNE